MKKLPVVKALVRSSFIFVIFTLFISSCAWLDPEQDPPPPPQDDPAQEITDDTDIILDPNDKGRILGKEITPEFPATTPPKSQQFRAMTFNLHLWGSNKITEKTKLVKKNGVAQPYETAIFSLFKTWKADVIALQEIYQPPTEVKVPFKETHGGFDVLYGDPIFVTKTSKKEYCAIAFRKSKMKCKSLTTQWALSRKIHWAQCTINPPPLPKKTFLFGCAHFAPSGVLLHGNINQFFETLYAATPKPTVNGVGQDNFIIGGDFNSYFHGLQGRRWKRENNAFNNKVPKPNKLTFVEIRPNQQQGGFTKIHKRKHGGKTAIKVANDKSKRIIDDLLWHLRPRYINYLTGSKKITPVTGLKSGGTWEEFWQEYYKLSDHIPVQADFEY